MENPLTSQMKQQPFSERPESKIRKYYLAIWSPTAPLFWLLLSDAEQLLVLEKTVKISAGWIILHPVWLHLVEDFLDRKQNKKREEGLQGNEQIITWASYKKEQRLRKCKETE